MTTPLDDALEAFEPAVIAAPIVDDDADSSAREINERRAQVENVELLAHLLHPDLVRSPGPSIGFAEVRAPQAGRA